MPHLPPQQHPSVLWHLPEGGDPEFDFTRLPHPTHEELIKHAERFGTHMIAETMAELGYSVEALTQAIERLDRIDSIRKDKDNAGRMVKRGSTKKQSAEKRAKKLLNWEEPTDDPEVPSEAEADDEAA